ncbi:GNAT family protein [Parvibaculum sp.]|uniref:GNAT family N-acetyltransferase n=1 Tax=Parvibaculum sp. TaxID=2024848 RepID=UPI001DCCB7AF|nr:GNAT family protein [Parvibaculum sp.]MBX3491060.1 GNAT family N-acetyltransferase [Parvibaculum sp.]MCW5728880.1 GNAT family N-acetyltransferase [Parvibaculum sp.]
MSSSPRTVRLRAPSGSDCEVLGRIRRSVDLQHLLLAYPDPSELEDLEGWLERRLSEPRGAFFVIADGVTDECLGYVQIVNVHGKGGNGSLGIAVDSTARGHGVGRQAVELILTHARSVMGLRKVELEVMAQNLPAIGLYKSLGFSDVGTRRRHYFDGDEWRDVLVMEIFLEGRKE